jgi:hypothetical protein
MMTLVEYAKGLEQGPVRAMVEQFATSSDIFDALPFEGLSAGAASYDGLREASLPSGLAFRGINEASTSGTGKLSPFSEKSYILDHDIDIDRSIVDRFGTERMSQHVQMGVKAAGKLWTDTFIDGSTADDAREFDGIKRRAARFSNRVINNSASSGGAALSLYNLDRAIANTKDPTHILASYNLMPRFIQAARNTSRASRGRRCQAVAVELRSLILPPTRPVRSAGCGDGPRRYRVPTAGRPGACPPPAPPGPPPAPRRSGATGGVQGHRRACGPPCHPATGRAVLKPRGRG